MSTSKIFGIGLSKTGTTSLANALELLGFRTKDYMGVSSYFRGDLSSIDLPTIDRYDALTDTPIPSFYRELDARYPGSKFVLTVRERAAWLKSCKKQFTQRFADTQNDAHKRLFLDLYGTDVFDEQKFAAGYESFVSGVLQYFKDRPKDLLVLDVAAGDGWEELCAFLGKPVPDIPFPKANVTQIRWINISDIAAIAREAGEELRASFIDGNPRLTGAPVASTTDRRGADLLAASRRLIKRAVHAVKDVGKDAAAAAEKRSHGLIVRALARMTPEIPVLSPLDETGFAQRLKLNHVWLVDPLSGSAEGASTHVQHAVSIALIEDGKPIYGAVYVPASETLYYAKSGQGAFKCQGGADPHRLPVSTELHAKARPSVGGSDAASTLAEGVPHESCSPALAVCRVAEGEAQAYRSPRPVMEWEIAAAHAIARCVGKSVRDCASDEELRYNKAELKTERIAVG